MDDAVEIENVAEVSIVSEEDEKDEDLYLSAKSTVFVREELKGVPVEFHLPKEMVRPPRPEKADPANWRPMLVGFDTEYQSLKPLFTSDEVEKKQAKYEVLSYQFYCDSGGTVTTGIVIPDARKRITFVDFVVYLAAKIAAQGVTVPRSIVLVGHYNKADLPAFDDRDL